MKGGAVTLRAAVSRPESAVLPALLRLPMSAMVATSALAGYLACPGVPHLAEAGGLTAGVFLLASGCSALNQVQERAEDALMQRTRRRPLPSGRITPVTALVLALLPIAGALTLLGYLEHPVAKWGLAALVLYNGVYTPLKKRTSFALLAGALCGALPPLMGWGAAGGEFTDSRILGLAALFVLWQIPHTWALGSRRPDDSIAGPFASLFRHLDSFRLARLNRVWLLALAIATLQLPAFGTLHSSLGQTLCLGLSGGLLYVAAMGDGAAKAKLRSTGLVLYMALLICLVMLDHLPL